MSWYGTKKASKLPFMDKSDIIVFDTETTGINPTIDEILQITILNGYGTPLFDSYIKPKHHKRWKAAELVNKISYSMVESAPTFSEVRREIQSIFNSAKLVVGYNVNFDINFLEASGIIVPGNRFDVMTAFASYRAAVNRTVYRHCKLTECAEYFHYYYTPHSSSGDADATLHCFDALISDNRFTTYRPKEKNELKAKNEYYSKDKRQTSFTVNVKTPNRNKTVWLGLLLYIISGGVYNYLNYPNMLSNWGDLLSAWVSVASRLPDTWLSLIFLALFTIGMIMIIIGVLILLLRIPKWIINQFRRLFGR